MDATSWNMFLQQWSAEILANKKYREQHQHLLPKHIQDEPWLGYSPASQPTIQTVEQRLHIVLPPSYRSFLLVSNGWSVVNSFVWRIPPIEEINWYRSHASGRETITIMEEIEAEEDELGYESTYDDYNGTIHAQTAKRALDIGASDAGYTDAVEYLLTPRTHAKSDEWDAWIVRFWKPWRVERYPSFWDLMQAEYQRFKKLEHE